MAYMGLGLRARGLMALAVGAAYADLLNRPHQPGIMDLLGSEPAKPADPVEDVFCWKNERPAGYSQSHWRKIKKERRQREPVYVKYTHRTVIA